VRYRENELQYMLTQSGARLLELRVENHSASDRHRLELTVPVAPTLPAEALRAACDEIEHDLR